MMCNLQTTEHRCYFCAGLNKLKCKLDARLKAKDLRSGRFKAIECVEGNSSLLPPQLSGLCLKLLPAPRQFLLSHLNSYLCPDMYILYTVLAMHGHVRCFLIVVTAHGLECEYLHLALKVTIFLNTYLCS